MFISIKTFHFSNKLKTIDCQWFQIYINMQVTLINEFIKERLMNELNVD